MRAPLIGLIAATLGCSDGPDYPSFSTGVDPSRRGFQLTPEEATTVCRTTHEFMRGKVASVTNEQICRFSGLWAVTFRIFTPPPRTDQEVVSECLDAYESCLRQAGPDPFTPGPTRCKSPSGDCPTEYQRCGATVGQVEACAVRMPEYWTAFYAALPKCQELSLAVLKTGPPSFPQEPAPCRTLRAACPELNQEDDLFPPFACP
jgi:hypothetical protein